MNNKAKAGFIKSLLDSDGWKVIQEDLQQDVVILQNKLEEGEVTDMQQLERLRTELRLYKSFISLPARMFANLSATKIDPTEDKYS